MSRTVTSLTSDFVAALRVKSPDPKVQAATIQSRLIFLGFGEYCGRCGGSGHYSFNLRDGTICFGCAGRGWVARELTASLLADVLALEPATLDAMLAELAERARFNKIVKTANDTVMAAWHASGVSAAYDWSRAADQARAGYVGIDRLVSDVFNKPMYDLAQAVEAKTNELQSLRGKLATTDPRLIEATRELAETVESAVAQIEALAAQLRDFEESL